MICNRQLGKATNVKYSYDKDGHNIQTWYMYSSGWNFDCE